MQVNVAGSYPEPKTYCGDNMAIPKPETVTPNERNAMTKFGITQRQYQVWALVAIGEINKCIGYKLGIDETTVKEYCTQLRKKLACTNRVQLALKFHGIDIAQRQG